MNDMIKIEKDMTPKLIGETWQKTPTSTNKQSVKRGIYECQYCGKEFEASSGNIQRGQTKSCGCLKGDAHGFSYHKFYNTWVGMLHRCTNTMRQDYKDYGGRGITVCEEWLDITNFIAWVESTHPNIEGVSLDRIDVDGNYEPNNCRWADASTQALNKRIMKNNTSGFVGVCWDKSKDKWVAIIHFNNVRFNIGSFPTKEEAVLARDNYIIENNLPHKLSTDYKEEN